MKHRQPGEAKQVDEGETEQKKAKKLLIDFFPRGKKTQDGRRKEGMSFPGGKNYGVGEGRTYRTKGKTLLLNLTGGKGNHNNRKRER